MDLRLDKPIINFARPVRALEPSDSAARAAGLFHAVGVSSLPVVVDGRVAGVVTEATILKLIAETLRDGGSAEQMPIAEAIRRQTVFAHRDMTVGQVAGAFASSDEEALPIVDEFGGFYGMVSRTDILAFLSGSLRPANIAGMATPLGVYLTNGSVRAGAGNIGLFLSGVMLGFIMMLSSGTVWAIAWLMQRITGLQFLNLLLPYYMHLNPKWLNAIQWVPPVLVILLVMLFIRFSPLSGYHAAEHMTVHAIEDGEELTPEIVRYMPRVHVRCGTNLLAASSIFLIIAGSFSSDIAVLLAIAVVIIGWRSVGGYIQRIATTKTPSPKQLENGVRVGQELIAKYQDMPSYQARGFARIWNIGILQSMAGLAFVIGLESLASKLFKFSLPFLGV
ncbi:MAG: DUF1385 domain-containing protein [Armatimonadota bacterium]|nr:DUF1385 domain-containing protein [Armatimonadota bacterium]